MSNPTLRHSLWQRRPGQSPHVLLGASAETDVLVIGAGMTGLLTAARLAERGLQVMVVDAGPIGGRNTGLSTGNLYAPISNMADLVARWDTDTARRITQWRSEAVRSIETLVQRHDIRCSFQRVPMQYGVQERSREATAQFERELHAYQRVGLDCQHQQSGLPFSLAHAFQVPDQAQFDPAAFCEQLAISLSGRVRIHDWTQILDLDPAGGVARTRSGTIRARHFVLATHSPLGFNVVQAEMEVYREYALAVPVEQAPEAGIHWIADRHRSMRGIEQDSGQSWLVLVGEMHRTGETPLVDPARHLQQDAERNFQLRGEPICWSAQQFRPADRLPYIGRSAHENVWMATGYGPDGLAWAGVAAEAISEGIEGHETEAAHLLSPLRFTPVRSAAGWARTNATVARHMIGDRLASAPSEDLEQLEAGQGALIEINGERTAAYRDELGKLHTMSPLCPHMKCVVQWNTHERTWDCPCHGSRFKATGAQLEGPASEGLAAKAG